jgi:hypothetical protein
MVPALNYVKDMSIMFYIDVKHGTKILDAVNVDYLMLAGHLLIPQCTAKPDLLGLPSEIEEISINIPLF